MATRTITAMFDNRAEAEQAIQALVSEVGLSRSAVRVDPGADATTGGATASAHEDKGFFASLKDLFVPDEDRHSYVEGMRRGGVLVSAQVEDAHIDRAMDVLERQGAVDLDEREASWRKEGWTGYSGAAAAGAGTGAVVGASSDGNRTGVAAMPGTGSSAPDGTPGNPPGTIASRAVDQMAGTNISGAHPEHETRGTATAAGVGQGEEAIPIVEEQIRIGKREVDRGRVRVRSYVVETPVQEQVALREEHVDVERRAVNRPVTDADRLFQERTIEATESAEEAVVAKEAHVVEEVVVRKEAEEHVQTVQDKVRRTEVEIEDERRTAGTTGTTTGTTGTATGTTRTPGGPDRV
ncbi:hypothetical protein GCM10009416_36310 [Craurococcus roseus]|uniref:DUF2382 domain-containing protein n=1 Tax=Craurococcus roseus TaxID=77585 RepID=A0ABN1FNW2_9PROT